MLSQKKKLLRATEVVAICGSVAALSLAIYANRQPVPIIPVFLVICAGMVILMLTFLPACMLAGEYVRSARKPSTGRQQAEGLNAGEVAAIFRWAPRTYIHAACLGVAVAVGTAVRFGSITFSGSHTITSDETTALALYFFAFFLLALPVLGSAARMPGAYAQGDA